MALKNGYFIKNPVANFAIRNLDKLLSFCPGIAIKKNFPIPPPKRLLLCNGAHLGDVILTTSLLQPIKEAFPEIQIGMLVGSWSKMVIEDHPLLDAVHIVDHWKLNRRSQKFPKKWMQYLKTKRQALKEIKALKYDIAIDVPFHFPNSAHLLYKAKIPVRIGFSSAGFSPLLTHPTKWSAKDQSAASYFYSLLKTFISHEPLFLKPCLPPLQTHPHIKEKPYLVLHMGTGNEKKQWPLEKWTELAQKLQLLGYYLVFTGVGEKEYSAIERVRKTCRQSLNLCDQLSWKEFTALIQNCKLLIAHDTAAGHIAAAYDIPSILLYTGINPEILWKPLSKNVEILIKQVPCSPCFQSQGCLEMSCIRQIDVDEALEKVNSLCPLI